MINFVCVFIQQSSLLGRRGELQHLLHHVHGELVPRVHGHDRSEKYLAYKYELKNICSFVCGCFGGVTNCNSCTLHVWLLWNWQFEFWLSEVFYYFATFLMPAKFETWMRKTVMIWGGQEAVFMLGVSQRIKNDTEYNWYSAWQLVGVSCAHVMQLHTQSRTKFVYSFIQEFIGRCIGCWIVDDNLTLWFHRLTTSTLTGELCSSAPSGCQWRRWFYDAGPWCPSIANLLLIPQQTEKWKRLL